MNSRPAGTSGNYKSKPRHGGPRISEMHHETRPCTIKYIDTQRLFLKMDNNLKIIDTGMIQEMIKYLRSDKEIIKYFFQLIEKKNNELNDVIDEKNKWQKNHDLLSRIPAVSKRIKSTPKPKPKRIFKVTDNNSEKSGGSKKKKK